jgi:ATP-dependent DNA ligase
LVRSELAVEVKYLTWTGDNPLRQVVYEGLREDKPASEVRREMPNAKPNAPLSFRYYSGLAVVTGGGGLCPIVAIRNTV